MKKKSDTVSLFRFFGITPQLFVFLLMGILVSGMVLGLLVKHSNKNWKKKLRPGSVKSVAVESVSPTSATVPGSEVAPGSATEIATVPGSAVVPGSATEIATVPGFATETATVPDVAGVAENADESKKFSVNSAKSVGKVGVSDDNLFSVNSLVCDFDAKMPVVAIVIDDMGVDMLRTHKILGVSDLYTFSYLTYAPNLSSQMQLAKSKGKELLLHIPMEAISDIYDYGPEVLKVDASRGDNLKLLRAMLDRGSEYIGINNHMGSKFTADTDGVEVVADELEKRGLMFLDSKTTPSSKIKNVVGKRNGYYAERDVFVDDSNDVVDIRNSLRKLENIARRRGYAVAIAHPRENTIKVLTEWLGSLKEKGIVSVPLSCIVKKFSHKKGN